MPLNPNKIRPLPTLLPLPQNTPNLLHQIPVLHTLPFRIEPSIPLPILIPVRHTINRILTIGMNGNISMPWRNVQRALNSGELGALVGWFAALQGFGDVSTAPVC